MVLKKLAKARKEREKGGRGFRSPQAMLAAALRQSSAHSAADLRAQLAMLVVVPLALGGAGSQMRAHSSSISRRTCSFDPVRRSASRAVASQTSAQSRQTRMHWRMSIFSAMQASAQLRHIFAQYIRWWTASPSGWLTWPCTPGAGRSSCEWTWLPPDPPSANLWMPRSSACRKELRAVRFAFCSGRGVLDATLMVRPLRRLGRLHRLAAGQP